MAYWTEASLTASHLEEKFGSTIKSFGFSPRPSVLYTKYKNHLLHGGCSLGVSLVPPHDSPVSPYTSLMPNRFVLHSYPACCGMGIMTNLFVEQHLRNKGIGDFLLEMVDFCCKEQLKLSYIVCVVSAESNSHEVFRKMLERRDWEQVNHLGNWYRGGNILWHYGKKYDPNKS